MSVKVRQAVFLGIATILLAGSASAENPADATFLREILSQARTQADLINNENARLVLLQNLAAMEARIGNVRLAQSEAERLESLAKAPPYYSNCDYIYQQILRTQARLGDYSAALRTIQQIAGNRDEAYYALAQELAKRGELDEARAILDQTARPDNVRRRAQIYIALAVASTRTGDLKRAAALFGQAETLSKRLLREAGVQAGTVDLALEVAAKRRACGNPEIATRLFSDDRSLIDGVADDSRRQQYMYVLASASAGAGDFDLAREVLTQITDPMRLAQARAAIARAHLVNGVEDTDAAFEAASDIPSLEFRISSLAAVASAQARKGQKQQAQRTLRACDDLLKDASDDFKPWGKLNLAAVQYELGNKRRAADLCDEAIRLSRRLTVHPERERALLYQQVARLRAGFGDEAAALKVVKRSGDPSLLEYVAEAEAEAGLSRFALKWIEQLKDPEEKARALVGVARGMLANEHNRQANDSLYPRCKVDD